ncbi:hypothetical protein V8D89_003223 [Ganoderma adspersum]
MLARQGFARVCPCSGARCLAASFSGMRETGRRVVQIRGLSTDQKPVSIFSPEVSPWDEIFDDIKDTAGPPPRVNPRSLKSASVGRSDSHAARAVAMTRRESDIFNNMFNYIFNTANAATSAEGGIGHLPGNSPVVGQLRRRLRWTTDADQELDRKKEAMELCETDLELLEWAMREVFGQSERAATASVTATEPAPKMSSAYPHLLAALMRTFRDKYRDPHLALAMFDHARNMSIASFVFGCTTPAYNELIETRWWCFRDLRGVVDALEEMRVNGIPVDGRTRMLTETVRREVGERTVWQEETSLGSGEVWEMVARIERLTAESVSEGKNKRRSIKTGLEAKGKGPAKERVWKPRKWSAGQEMWKKDALDANARDGWAFDEWKLQKPAPAKKRPLRL